MGLAQLITGKKSKITEDDMSPGMMSPPTSRALDRNRRRRFRSRLKEDESIIPTDAEQVKPGDDGEAEDASSKGDVSMPDVPDEEGMFPVAAALVAPDVMPDLFRPLSPSKIPSAPRPDRHNLNSEVPPGQSNPPGENAIDTILGKDQEAEEAPRILPNVESLLRSMGTPSHELPFANIPRGQVERPLQETIYTPRVAAAVPPNIQMPAMTGGGIAAALVPGGGMPAPAPVNPSKVSELVRAYR